MGKIEQQVNEESKNWSLTKKKSKVQEKSENSPQNLGYRKKKWRKPRCTGLH